MPLDPIPEPTPALQEAIERQRSSRRRLGIVVLAILVCILPTACDAAYGATPKGSQSPPGTGTGTGSTGTGAAGHGGHAGHGAPAPTVAPTVAPGTAPTTAPNSGTAPTTAPAATTTPATTSPAPTSGGAAPAPPVDNGLDLLGRDCTGSDLTPHTGFQIAPACVSTEFGEVADEDKSPSLLITDAPTTIAAGTPFTIKVSTRNLVRDRFLGAAAGGYYLESSFLTPDGLQRGHFHTACRMLPSTTAAPDAAPVPDFFLATQDGGGGATPDTVSVTVPGLPSKGTAQCTSWAGDGSHRIPMMQRANQTPAVDSVRITVS
ncbi:hypothetical protein [Pseudonocardia sp. GCM10023141]|uniref:hypothetical protein n=1 Tax=Pseudonocardia sp. GCM10023141 TaxID=3252653 RepID=UPI0036223E8F